MPDKRLALFETFGSIAWFLMDASWMFGRPIEAAVLAVVAFLLTAAATAGVMLMSRPPLHEACASAAALFWLVMNIHWMASDLLGHPELLPAAKFFGLLGVLAIALGILASPDRAAAARAIASRFRRFRVGK